MKNFDPRIIILFILVGIVIYKVTAKEKYMCGGKREGYVHKTGGKREGYVHKTGGKREGYDTGAPIKKSGVCPKCGSTDQVYGQPCPVCSKKGGTEGYCSSCGMK